MEALPSELEFIHLKEKLIFSVRKCQSEYTTLFNTLISSRSQSDTRKKDINEITKIIDQAKTRDELTEQLISYCKNIKTGLLGRSELASQIQKIIGINHTTQYRVKQ